MVEEQRDERDSHSHSHSRHHHRSHHARHSHHSRRREGEHLEERGASREGEHLDGKGASREHTKNKHRSHRSDGHSTHSRSSHSESGHKDRRSSHDDHRSQTHSNHRSHRERDHRNHKDHTSHSHREHRVDKYRQELKSDKKVDRTDNRSSKNEVDYPSSEKHSDRLRERSPVRSNEIAKTKTLISLTHSGLLNGPSKSQSSRLLTEEEVKPIIKKYDPPEDEYTPNSSDPKFYVFKYSKEKLVTQIPLNNYKSFFTIGSKDSNSDIVINSDGIGKDELCVIQFRKIYKSHNSSTKVLPYLVNLSKDLNVLLNDEKVPCEKFIQLLNQDVITFGKKDLFNTEFVLIID